MKKMTYLLNLTLFVVCSQFLFADNANEGGKQMYISFEDAQAALPDKEYAQPQNSDDNSGGSRNAPNWEDCPACYEFTASMTALVLEDGDAIADDGDLLAAFDADGNVRGLATQIVAEFGPFIGQTLFTAELRSNAGGDVLTFYYYDASEDVIKDITESYTFVINDLVGTLTSPFVLNAGAPDLSCPECTDNDAGVAPFTCADAVASFGCDFLWGGTPISDSCPATCGTCPQNDACDVCEGDGSSCADCAGTPNGDAWTDCVGSCLDIFYMSYLGDGWCDDGAWGVDFVSCGDFNCDDGDCGTELVDGECVAPSCDFFDCNGLEACGYEDWVGDGYCDGTDMAYGLDFSCLDCDGGDCSGECGCELDIADGACDCDGNVDAGCGCGEAGPSV